MRLSTRAKYGLRLCFLIAVSNEEIVSLTTLVKQTNLSEKYLEQILAKLKKNSIVVSKRGSSGGYSLARNKSEISINDILIALDDDFEFTDCVSGKCKDAYCPNKKIFSRIYEGVNEILNQTTLQDMIQDYSCL